MTDARPDAVLRRRLLRHVAALVGAELADRHRLASALIDGTGVDRVLIQDLIILTDQYVEEDEHPTILRGHLLILEELAAIASPESELLLRPQVERAAVAFSQSRR